MRNKDKKCKKNQESTIGKIIYGFLLFMPLLAIGFTCLYAVFNKNAYQSYYGENINEETNITPTKFEVGNKYTFNSTIGNFSYVSNAEYLVSNITDVDTNINVDSTIVNEIRFRQYNDSLTINLYNNNTYLTSFNANSSSYYICNFEYRGVHNDDYKSFFLETIYNKDSFVSEVFYYSVDRVSESNLFNWAQNSVIYTTTNATCNALSITTPFIPLLMSYWLIISIIYFLYDIALMLVWLIHRKIHELQESL